MAVIHSVFTKRLDLQLAAIIKKSTGKIIAPQNKTWPCKSVLEIFLTDPFTISKTIDAGLPAEFFDTALNYSALTKEEWATILDLSLKTIERYGLNKKNLPAPTSEKIIQILEITSLALTAFATIENFRRWLDIPNKNLKKIKPINLLKNAYGQQLIIAQIKSQSFPHTP